MVRGQTQPYLQFVQTADGPSPSQKVFISATGTPQQATLNITVQTPAPATPPPPPVTGATAYGVLPLTLQPA